jgi:hypothetical protein
MEYILHVNNCKHGDEANSEVEKRSLDYTIIRRRISLALNISGQRNNSSQVPFLTFCQYVEGKIRLALLRT